MSKANGIRYESLRPAQILVVIAYLIIAFIYLSWRPTVFNPEAPIFSVLLYVAELYGFFTALLHLVMTWRLAERDMPDAPPGLSVDVFVTSLNEPVSLVRHTLLAAIGMDYPHKVWLLDDGNRPEMAQLAAELGCSYHARGDNEFAKAGNLNAGLAQSRADFVAVFDADHAPARRFLIETLGYFNDPKVSFVQTPQDFFNLDSYQHRKNKQTTVWTEQSLFFRVIQRGKDYWNAAFFCGSCAVLRRSSLDTIGGFATGTVTEDLHTSLKLHKAGFASVYHPHSLAFGIAPASIVPFIKQRIRWGQGAMQIWRREGILFSRGLTFAQRLNYLASMSTYFDGWQKGFFYLAPIIVLTTGLSPISSFSEGFLIRFIPYIVLTFFMYEEISRGYGRSLMIEQYNFARFWAFAWATLAAFRGKLKFNVTSKEVTGSSYRRFVMPQFLIMVLSIAAVPIGLTMYAYFGKLPLDSLIANTIWAVINGGLALLMLLFTRASSQSRRHEYRFPIPLPAQLHFPNGTTTYGTVDDISSSGFRLYAQLPDDVRSGTEVDGELYLPSGPLPIRANIAATIRAQSQRPDEPGYIKAIGCVFDWKSATERDRLDLFLYGSDLQWHVQSLTERSRTPLQFLSDLFSGKPAPNVAKRQWTTVLYRDNPEETVGKQVGLLSRDLLLTFSPLAAGIHEVTTITRTGLEQIQVQTDAETVYDSPVAPIFGHVLPQQAEKPARVDTSPSTRPTLAGSGGLAGQAGMIRRG
ncbi:glycosyltransferase [Jeongeupia wiesaeckerbachi]|uniref:glycosyltransferase n=1 Tax=Jeongeupia wiesaeckerbachi TaxID=3051218 RepID=UPI003D804FE7